MPHHGLFIASDYVGTQSRLSGCIKDCDNWHDTFAPALAGKIKLQGRNATKQNVVGAMRAITKQCPRGGSDYYLITFSGHGTFKAGSATEKDGRDEAICCDDFLHGGLLWDNEIAEILANSQGTFVTDCCHSGTMIRATVADYPLEGVPRFVPFDQICEGLAGCEIAKICEPADRCRVNARAIRGADGAIPGVIHLAGCLDNEYSYDTAQGGAMTLTALSIYRSLAIGATHRYWIELIQRKLPTPQFPQHPVMTATDADIERVVAGKELPAPQPPIQDATGETFEGVTSSGRKIRGTIS